MDSLTILDDILKKYRKVLVAYSGGVDSTFLLARAVKALGKNNVLAVTAVSETYPASEMAQAKKMVKLIGARHKIIRTSELANKNFSANSVRRCFYCKDELFKKLSALAKQNKMALIDATNFSDLGDYRPGRDAAKKWKVHSPLVEAEITKTMLREFSRKMKLQIWNAPAQACLASRFPFGTPITAAELKRVEQAETYLKSLGLKTVRVRHHGEIARIETAPEEIPILFKPSNPIKISSALKKLGWKHIAVELSGYQTGSLNP